MLILSSSLRFLIQVMSQICDSMNARQGLFYEIHTVVVNMFIYVTFELIIRFPFIVLTTLYFTYDF